MTDYSYLRPALDYLERKTGLVFTTAQIPQVVRAVASAMDGKADSVDEFIALLEADRVALDNLISQVTINETYFMRDPAHFAFITSRMVPAFLAAAEFPARRKFKAWSAACSTGEEAYSLAITLAQAGLLERSTILASDIDAEALERARLAAYSEWSFRNTEPGLRAYFTKPGSHSHLKSEVKDKVTFFKLNLATDMYPAFSKDLFDLDLIMCRNVLIYFDQQTIERTAKGMFDCLNEDGVLITGPSDPNLALAAPFKLYVEDGISYYRKPKKLQFGAGESKTIYSGFNTGVNTGTNISITGSAGTYGQDRSSRSGSFSTRSSTNTSALNSGKFSTSNKYSTSNSSTSSTFSSSAAGSKPSNDFASSLDSTLEQAEEAFKAGHYEKVCKITMPHLTNEKALLLFLKSTANDTDSRSALKLLEQRIHSYPLSTPLHYLAALLYIDTHQIEAAHAALTRTLYLAPSLAIAHFTMAFLLKGKGDSTGAKRSLRNCIDMCSRVDKTAILELSDGEPAGRIMEVAKRELATLEGQS